MTLIRIILLISLGWLGGLAVNYLADVLPMKKKITAPICVACGAQQSIVSYLLLRPCGVCKTKRGRRSWLVVVFYLGASLALWFTPPTTLGFPISFLLLVYFGVVVVIDIEHHLILHMVSVAGAVLCAVIGFWLHGFWRTIIGGAIGFGIMLGLYVGGNVLMRWLARRRGETLSEDALGFGDVNLSGVIGLLLGWPAIASSLLLAIVLAGAVSFVYLALQVLRGRYHRYMALPYGPFLVLGAVFLLYFRDTLIRLFGV